MTIAPAEGKSFLESSIAPHTVARRERSDLFSLRMKILFRTIALLAVTPGQGMAQAVQIMSLDDAGSQAEVVSIFSVVPPTGYAPVRLRVKNDAAKERTITIGSASISDR